ncbi:PI31 proteasome regulator [Macrophomina phaseolina MS6]|uniref:PI31 proteasome regulator n=1 Tax=Macrophomina phaseolina (strain MS6) TaxID=1126212 RepID=K2RT27_MACPH|nr:PI31 proteasome regulator [Macrophomina phaseolina MS6]
MPNTAGNPLSAGSLALFMTTSLPRDASPQLKNPYDAIALAVHAGMVAVGFRLIGLGEDHRIEARSDAHEPHPLPAEWNASSSYAFRYAHDQSSMEYLIKVNRLGSKAVILAVGLGDDKTASFEVVARDYISESSLPATPLPGPEASIENASKTIQDIFISTGRLNDLGSLLKISVLQKVAPGLRKEGYEETSTAEGSSSNTDNNRGNNPPIRGDPSAPTYDPLREDAQPPPARPHPFDEPLAAAPRRPFPAGDFPPPGFEDEYEINRPPRNLPGRGPLGNYGESDLYPPGLGPHDPMTWGGVGGGLRGGPTGGMHPTFDDPLFAGRGGQGGYDPRAPPGARYDPVNPGDQPRDPLRGGRFPGGGGFGGGAPPNPFGGFGNNDFI